MNKIENFFTYQGSRLAILLAWGAGNTLVGLGGSLISGKSKAWRQFWLQCAGWGFVNALIAVFGQRGANAKATKSPDASTTRKEADKFFRLLLINAVLDIGYMLSGWLIARSGKGDKRESRQGVGRGFIVQGLFLFLYDSLLSLDVHNRWRKS